MKVQIGIFECTGIMGQDLIHPYIQSTTVLSDYFVVQLQRNRLYNTPKPCIPRCDSLNVSDLSRHPALSVVGAVNTAVRDIPSAVDSGSALVPQYRKQPRLAAKKLYQKKRARL